MTIAPFLLGQVVRVVRVPHKCLEHQIGWIESVDHVDGCIVWCKPERAFVEGQPISPDWHRVLIARRVTELEAVTCA